MLFFVVDYHALTTNYEHSETLDQFSYVTVVNWLSAGVNLGTATVFARSTVPEHAELHPMLSMIMPLTWFERLLSYKDQQQKRNDRDLATYDFLGYPLLQAEAAVKKCGKKRRVCTRIFVANIKSAEMPKPLSVRGHRLVSNKICPLATLNACSDS